MSAVVDYTSRDYDSLKQSLLEYAAQTFPDWTPGSEGDFGVLLLELLAYVGDVNSYYIDRAQNEAYLPTATQMSSVLNLAQLLGYVPGTGAPALGQVSLVASNTLVTTGAPAITVPAGTQVASGYIAAIDGQVIYETNYPVVLTPGQVVTVDVTEGSTQTNISLGPSTGLPDQEFKLPKPRVYVETVSVSVSNTAWRKVSHLLDADDNDQVFEVYNDADGYTWVRFGDGLNGAVPPIGLAITVTYRTGYGAQGNLQAGQVTTLVSANLSGVSVQKSSSSSGLSTSTVMTGGADPESKDQIRNNAPKTFFSQQRAVTIDDFKNSALAVQGVSKASAVADYFSSVTVYIVGPDGGTPNSTLVDRVQQELSAKALAGVSVNVGTPTAVPVNVGGPVSVEVWPTFSRPAVQYGVEQALRARLAFVSTDLGSKLTVSDLYKTIMSVEGVRYAAVPLMARSDASQTGTADIQFQPWEYPVAGTITVTSTGGMG